MFPVFKPEKPFRYFISKKKTKEEITTLHENFKFFKTPPARIFKLDGEVHHLDPKDSISLVINEKEMLVA
jgi:hypothetical protein